MFDHGHQQAPAGSGEGKVRGDVEVISRWTEHLVGRDTVEIGQRLPPHSPDCAGCGPGNPAGLGLEVVRTAAGVEAVHRFSDAQVGAPGIAHGGAVALAFDDLFGFALYTVGSLAVTRSLTIEYHAPFWLHRPYTFSAHVAQREGRRLLLRADAWDDAGQKAGSAAATFVVVSLGHFAAGAEQVMGRDD
ncbi:PaaI family thioesterase [Nocardioides luteus]|uniref:PaaI family thioesterase n=1 Tax=Nocardioides luteus TaxID=1844 RepID=UPI0009FB9BE0|nr:PaaI family thioesterase [Nocardioides luteus]